MAAHVVAALEQIRDHVKAGKSVADLHLDSALRLSSWTEDLDMDDYRSLGHLTEERNPCSLSMWAEVALLKYRQIWTQLGRPETREQWGEVFWKKKAYLNLLIDVTWEGNPYGKGLKSYGVAIVPCRCMSCDVERVEEEV